MKTARYLGGFTKGLGDSHDLKAAKINTESIDLVFR